MCPRGDYAHFFALAKRHETQAVVITNVFTPGTDANSHDEGKGYRVRNGNGTHDNGEFALTFRSALNEEFTTRTLDVFNVTEASVQVAINELPNKVINGAEVVLFRNLSKYNVTEYAQHQAVPGRHYDSPYPFDPAYNYTWYDTDLVILITFDGPMNAGDVLGLECRTALCGSGCQPKISAPLDHRRGSECHVINNYEPATAVNWECSGRGHCDGAGVCNCFQGYTDEFCSTRRAII
jgi:hypothetical protein